MVSTRFSTFVGFLTISNLFKSSSGSSYNRYHNDENVVHNHLSSTKIGKFQLFWDALDPYFYVTHSDEPDKILFQTLPSQSFITVGYATDANPPIVDGNFKVFIMYKYIGRLICICICIQTCTYIQTLVYTYTYIKT